LPPPENVLRLRVLCDSKAGALRTDALGAVTDWCEEAPRANLGDVLRVHDFPYVKSLQARCELVEEGKVSLLDGDTAVSKLSFEAAMHSAGK
jgi:acetoin utilization deacetylase AcuC-like enzyme